ncbi:MAG: cation transporter [Deltaproteobacteria bacterium]|nr:cation transporter [Deltaproteobacteria bacterium]
MRNISTFLVILGFSSFAIAKSFTFHVDMACQACSSAIEKAFQKHHAGMYSNFNADPEADTVTLDSDTLTEAQIIETIEKKAKFKVSQTPIGKKTLSSTEKDK